MIKKTKISNKSNLTILGVTRQLGTNNLDQTTWIRQLGPDNLDQITWARQLGPDNLVTRHLGDQTTWRPDKLD